MQIRSLRKEEMRAIPVHRTSSSAVEDKIAAIAKMKHQGGVNSGDKSLLLAARTTQYPDIIAFSLAAFIANQLSRGVKYFYHQHLTKVAEATLRTLLSHTPLPSAAPRFTTTSPEAERCFLQMHVSTVDIAEKDKSAALVLSASFVQSYWGEANCEAKSSILKSMGFLENESHQGKMSSSGSNKSSGKGKGKKGGNTVKRASSTAVGSNGVSSELLRADFKRFIEIMNPRSDLDHQQESQPLLASHTDVSTDWWDIEEGIQDEESLKRFQELVKMRNPEYCFEQWCLAQVSLGSGLCEYVSTCPLEKLFTPNRYWNSWSIDAYQLLEKKWMVEEAERMLIAYDDDTSTVGVLTTESSTGNKRSSKSKKKQKKSSKRKSSAARNSDDMDSFDTVEGHGSGGGHIVQCSQDVQVINELPAVEMRISTSEDSGSLLAENSGVQKNDSGSKKVLEYDKAVNDFMLNDMNTTSNLPPGSDEGDTGVRGSDMLSAEESISISEPMLCVPPQCESDNDISQASLQGTVHVERDKIKTITFHGSVVNDAASSCNFEGDIINDDIGYTSSGVSSVVSSTSGSDSRMSLSTAAKSACSSTTSTCATSTGDTVNSLDCIIPQTLTKCLSEDIHDMAIGLRNLADQRRPWQLGTIEKVKEITKSIWMHAVVDIFGSFSTGLAIPSSDVDIIICGVNSQHMQWFGGRLMSPLAILSQQLQQAPWVTTLKTIENTAMPVIKVTTAPVPIASNTLGSGAVRGIIKLDISFSTTFGAPLHSAGFLATGSGNHTQVLPNMHQGIATRDFVMKLCAMNHALVPLTLVLKQFLSENGLHDPYTGGLTSYAVTIMVASILQPYVLEPPHTHPDLGTLLLIFFRKFGTKFDTRKHAVALTVNGPFVPLSGDRMPRVGSKGYWNPPDPVVVIDPLNSQNNLGRSCFGFRQLQLTFDAALESAFRCLAHGDRPAIPPLTSILGVMFGAGHHNSVLKLVSRLWCPTEIKVSGVENGSEEISSTQNSLESMCAANTSTSKSVKDRCDELLSQMNEQQLNQAHQLLLDVLHNNPSEMGARSNSK